ncbi:hypothetical protein AGMMS49940_03780 [Spirochaetia bacterium]|nr:hypothetical protein AGMMS49940_03780 [Spirochaetia bacterium]
MLANWLLNWGQVLGDKDNEEPNDTIQNSGRLCSIYCPRCKRLTAKFSFNLLREADAVDVTCYHCNGIIHIDYDGKTVSIEYL